MTCDIRRSDKGPYYTMMIDGVFAGNFDTVTEAANEFDTYLDGREVSKEGKTA